MSILSACQTAARRIGLQPIPTSVVGASNDDAIVLLGMVHEAVQEIVRRHDWQALRREHTWTTTATEQQANAFPSDYFRSVAGTAWNRDDQCQLIGPLTSEEWQRLKATVSSAIFDSFTIRNGVMYVDPIPAAGQTWAYEYITKNFYKSDDGVEKAAVTADGDIFQVDEELLALAIVWRFRAQKSMDYAEHYANYEKFMGDLIAQERGGSRMIDFDNSGALSYRGWGIIIPEGDWSL